MIRAGGSGVAMGNAAEAKRRAARWVPASNEEPGIAVFIDRMLKARAG